MQKYGYEEAKTLDLAAAGSNHNNKPKITEYPDVYKAEKFRKLLRSDVAVLIVTDVTRCRLQTIISHWEIAPSKSLA